MLSTSCVVFYAFATIVLELLVLYDKNREMSKTKATADTESSFIVQCIGQIVGANFENLDYLYCKYNFYLGKDWSISGGLDTGLSQVACKNHMYPTDEMDIIWNFPIDIAFNSTNVYGWPRIAISVHGTDFLGRDVVRGYGSVLLPLTSGRHELEIQMYTPIASSTLASFVSWLSGKPPEFFDTKFVCQGEGREVSRVQHTGSIKVNLNILTKGMEGFGYSLPK